MHDCCPCILDFFFLKMDLDKVIDNNSLGKASIKSKYLYHEEPVANQDVNVEEPLAKKFKSNDKKKARGQNKNRFYSNKNVTGVAPKLCQVFVDVAEDTDWPVCNFPECKFLHDVKKYLSEKLPDLGPDCFVFQQYGHCPRGVTCRFASKHITCEGKNKNLSTAKIKEKTLLSKELQIAMRKKKYNFDKANEVTKTILKSLESNKDEVCESEEKETEVKLGSIVDYPEKRIIDWKDKLYLSPLTTLGNLPFRRICKEWGADVTCGEMAMAGPLLQGVACEWALLRRHSSENLFGVQVCGNSPHLLARCVQLIEENADVDFIDLNLGCPIELVYKTGAGSGLLRRKKHLESVVKSMSAATKLPITVKTRTGIYDGKPVAHTYMPLYTASGVSLITIHGRSREQRYTRQPDWSYINECASLASPTPVFGNGDILSYHDYNAARANCPNISGVMIGRGALYKPWIFTEIKEQRDWDISSAERFEILRKFVNYGFEHWGSDTKGVENTRRFLLEWLSFLYRYIPVGVLERLPQKMNERPPRYVGRNDLETMMASPNCADWIKISEMLCGPVPEGFQFLPKHKANSWATD